MAENQTIEKTVIQKRPNVCDGEACIGNRRIMVWLLVAYRRDGLSDDRIMASFDPPVTPADLEAAWDYYAQNKDEIDRAIFNNETDADQDE